MRTVALWFFLTSVVWAEDVVHCTLTTYDFCRSIGDTTVFLNDPNNLTTTKPGYFYQSSGCGALLPNVSDRYRTCVDTSVPVDGVPDVIQEMTQAQKDVLDAPDVAAQQRSDALQSEIHGNDYCLGELAELQTRIDTATTNWVVARQAEVDASPNNVAGVKTLIRNQLIPGIGQALNAGFLKALRCLKARTDRGVGQ